MESMANKHRFQRAGITPARMTLEQILFMLSAYVLPAIIAIFTMITLLVWDSSYATADARKLQFRVIAESTGVMSANEAASSLRQAAIVDTYDTKLSETPVWFAVTPPVQSNNDPKTIEMPSRHMTQIACWDGISFTQLGGGDHSGTTGNLREVRAGFAMELSPAAVGHDIICRASFIGPARLTLREWRTEDLQVATWEFQRNSGLLDGGLLVLAVFVLIAALINRNSTYVLFAAWLLVNARMGALSAGWDTQWLGHSLPSAWMPQIRETTTAVYYLVTLSLFCALFREDITRVGYRRLLRTAQLSCIPLLVLSVALPFKIFLPILWVVTGLGTSMMTFFLIRILMLTRSPVAIWYAASIGITLFVGFYEVLAAAIGYQTLSGAINFVTAALASSLLAALAIAHQMRIEHRQRIDAQAELQHTFHAMPIGLFTLDVHGKFLSANPALAAMLGTDVMAPGRNSWAQYFHGGAWEQLHTLMHSEGDGELQLRRNRFHASDDGQHFMVKATLARGKIEGSLQDVTEQVKATENLRFMANNDPLTKVYNRRGIENVLENAVRQLGEGKPLALAYLDLDRFKLINDLYGHATGDEVLKQVCERVSGMLAGGQNIGRVGGDEFVIVLPDTAIGLATWICRGIVNSISSSAFRIGDKAFQVRGSVGVIEVSDGTQIRDALATADRACRAAKDGHHDSLVVYHKDAPAFREREAELDLVERLSTGVAPEGLFVEMQPIMSLKTPHESLNFEVLLRMRDRDGSLIPTPRVITAAENSGRISVIDRWVMSTTLAWLDANQDTLTRTQFVCMNLSGASLNDERFIQDAFAMLSKNLRAAGRLCIEITESVALHDLDNTRRFIDKVRGYGVKVALDDFGAGYTSFSYLRELPADILKIDGNFIVDMNAHPANIAIVEAIVSLAMNLGMKTIAEWAEDTATVQTLAEIGVDYVQGFAVARPQDPARILAADSAASFIQDEALTRFVRGLAATATNLSPIDLRNMIRFQDMH
jgi:diguanylate cyclase (GGDEF)-like protein/PAS domain S-box-containing protein